MGLIVFAVSFVIFYGYIFYIHGDYDYDQENWWYGGKK